MSQHLLFPLLLAFGAALIIGPIFIPFLKRLKFGQSIREEGPQSHHKKSGTPTMGGLIFLIATAITLITLYLLNVLAIDMTFMMLTLSLIGYGLIGFVDDFIIVVKKNNEGLRPKYKVFGQFALAALFFFLFLTAGYPAYLSLFGLMSVNLSWGYGIFLLIWMIGFSNATNLTDGLDGLCAGVSMIAFAVFGIIAASSGQYTVMLFCLTMVGALAGFLVFNLNPAKVFMGDTGSLAIGGSLAAVSILLGKEWLLLLVGFVYVIETTSVILQVLYFKKTDGKRLFKMAPLHHHFELSGWSERKVVSVFWIISLLMGLLALYLTVV